MGRSRSFVNALAIVWAATLLICWAFLVDVFPAEVTLQWNPVERATGYKLYHGSGPRDYETPRDVGADVTSTVAFYFPGKYYFAVTAYNNYGESGYSEEVSATLEEQKRSGFFTITKHAVKGGR